MPGNPFEGRPSPPSEQDPARVETARTNLISAIGMGDTRDWYHIAEYYEKAGSDIQATLDPGDVEIMHQMTKEPRVTWRRDKAA